MRILVVSQYYWPESFRITEVVCALRDEGHDVLVLAGQPNYPDGVPFPGYRWWALGTEPHDGSEVLRVPLFPRGKGSALRLALNYLSFIVSATLFGPWLLRGRPVDKILVFGMSPILQAIPAVWLAFLKQAHLVTWVQDLWPESLSATGFVRNRHLLAVVAAVVRWIYQKSDLLLVQSRAFIAPVETMAGATPVRYHPNPGDFAFSAAPDAACPIDYVAKFSVVFAGNLGTVQALDTLLDAAELLREDVDIDLLLVGGGSRFDWLQAEISRRGLANVKLPGRFPLAAMPSIMAGASALLVSLMRSEIMSQTVPSKVQAYLAAGRPIIASLDGEGARIVLEAEAGVASPAEDAAALAEAIRTLKSTPAPLRDRMGCMARAYYEDNFEPRLLARNLVALLATIGEGGR